MISDRAPLRIAYLCDFDPRDRNIYSGGNARLFDALGVHADEVHVLSHGWSLAEPLRRLVHRFPDRLNIRLRWRLHLLLAPLIARGVERELAAGQYDVLFCAYSFQSLYRVRPPYPMVTAFTSDATMTIYRKSVIGNSFGSFFTPSRLVDPLVERVERKVFQSTHLLLWPSEWMQREAETAYGLRPNQSVAVPWGANIDTPEIDPDPPRLDGDGPVRLHFVGRDWQAKGGPKALSVLRKLRLSGIDAHMTVVGCVPPHHDMEDHVTVYPSLDKANPWEMEQFRRLFREAHFMVLPSLESYGFAFCEASAYGVPSLCLDAGGVPVRDQRNGHAFDVDADASRFVDVIRHYIDAPDTYDEMRRSTRREFDTRLNWDVWAQQTTTKLRDKVAERRRAGAGHSVISDQSPA